MGTEVLVQRCRNESVDVFACFLDYEKTCQSCHTIQREKLPEILRKQNLIECDIIIMVTIYWHQRANITVDGEVSEEIKITCGSVK